MAERGTVTRAERVLEIIETTRAKRPKFKDERVTMAHGAGGKASQTLIEGLLVPAFDSEALAGSPTLGDAGSPTLRRRSGSALTTDSFVVRPLRFPGGSIGELAVNGTVNDLPVAGARPVAISVALLLEEGLGDRGLRAEVEAIAAAAAAAEVEVVAGDTKVVERGPRRRDVRLDQRDRRPRPAGRALAGRAATRRPGPGLAARSASTARRSCSPAASSGSRPRSSPTPARCGRPPTRCSRPRARGCAACATRPAAGSPRCSTSWRAPRASRSRSARRGAGARRGRGRLRAPRHRSDVRRQRGRAGGLGRAGVERRGAGGAALGRGLRGGGGDGRGRDGAARGWCWWRRRSAAGG